MRLLSFEMPANYNLFLFGDNHIGAKLRDSKGFNKLKSMMGKKYHGCKQNYGIDHGDFIEAIAVDDYRYCQYDTLEQNILLQMEMAKREYWSIRDKLLVMLDGNHPFKYHRLGPLTHKLCQDLGVSFGTYSAKITYLDKKGNVQFKHYATHGSGTINSSADSPERRYLTKRLGIKKKLMGLAGDTLLMSCGHTHKLLLNKPFRELYLTDRDGKIKSHYTKTQKFSDDEIIHSDYRYYVNTGSFLKLFGDDLVEDDSVPLEQSKMGSGYAERAMYPPTELGFAVGIVRGNMLQDVELEYL